MILIISCLCLSINGYMAVTMNEHVPICGLFETHLTVSYLQQSIAFYRDIVGLRLALEVSESNATFFWIGDHSSYSSSRRSMLGLWSIGTSPICLNLHVAFEVVSNQRSFKCSKTTEKSRDNPAIFLW